MLALLCLFSCVTLAKSHHLSGLALNFSRMGGKFSKFSLVIYLIHSNLCMSIPHPLIGLADIQGHLLALLFYISLCVNSHLISCPTEVSFMTICFSQRHRLLFKRMQNPLASGGARLQAQTVWGYATGPWPSGCTALKHWHPGLQSLPITEKCLMPCK